VTVTAEPRRPDDPSLADELSDAHSVYIHIPFCRRRCPYCDFAVVADGESTVSHRDYVDAVLTDMASEAPWESINAINFGGGTPSAIDPSLIAELIDRCSDIANVEGGAEVSIEANPEDWSSAFGSALRSKGVNRITFGVQSLDQTILGVLGRTHDRTAAMRAITGARELGFSVGADLIFGTPTESLESWRETVQATLDAGIDHLSAYGLTVERGTDLSRAVAAGAPAPDPDDQADKYEITQKLAGASGLVQYEVSNYARIGHHCVYNLSTWGQGEYLAFGTGAHGHRDGVRYRNIRRIERYLEAVAAGERPWAGTEFLSPGERKIEGLFLGLRRMAGVSIDDKVQEFLATEDGRRFVGAGLVDVSESRVRVATPLLTDTVVRSVLSLSPDDC
jgi:putative oxygen-independent coproporphyrinogen III oxidase